MNDASVIPAERLDAAPPTVPAPWQRPYEYRPDGFVTGEISFYPCDEGYHDLAVGPDHAVCNRCEKVIALGADDA